MRSTKLRNLPHAYLPIILIALLTSSAILLNFRLRGYPEIATPQLRVDREPQAAPQTKEEVTAPALAEDDFKKPRFELFFSNMLTAYREKRDDFDANIKLQAVLLVL